MIYYCIDSSVQRYHQIHNFPVEILGSSWRCCEPRSQATWTFGLSSHGVEPKYFDQWYVVLTHLFPAVSCIIMDICEYFCLWIFASPHLVTRSCASSWRARTPETSMGPQTCTSSNIVNICKASLTNISHPFLTTCSNIGRNSVKLCDLRKRSRTLPRILIECLF